MPSPGHGNAETHGARYFRRSWIPAFAGMTGEGGSALISWFYRAMQSRLVGIASKT